MGSLLRVASAPAEWAYGALVRARNRRWDREPPPPLPGCPVVSVGNLVVGGTGKTPFCSWALGVLEGLGRRPALVARGYGEDELLLYRRWHPAVPVVADRDRVEAVVRARAGGAGSVVVDDGFQHRRLGRALDVVLLAAEDPWPGRLLPRGPYREPPEGLARADVVVVTRRTAGAEEASRHAGVVDRAWGPFLAMGVVALEAGGWCDLDGANVPPPSGALMAAAGIARPEAFSAGLERLVGDEVELVSFPDHHAYDLRDAEALRRRAGGRTLVVTEKDAVKLVAFGDVLGPTVVLRQVLRWERGEREVRELMDRRTGPRG